MLSLCLTIMSDSHRDSRISTARFARRFPNSRRSLRWTNSSLLEGFHRVLKTEAHENTIVTDGSGISSASSVWLGSSFTVCNLFPAPEWEASVVGIQPTLLKTRISGISSVGCGSDHRLFPPPLDETLQCFSKCVNNTLPHLYLALSSSRIDGTDTFLA